jgi:hypothetical protein
MVRTHRLYALAIWAMTTAPLAGCATMYHRGNGLRVKVEENGRKVDRLALNLDHASRDLRIFENGEELTISPVKDHIFANALDNSVRQAVAHGAAAASCVGVCTYNWDEVTEYGPAVFLDPHRSHTLRLVRGDQEASVTVKTHFRPKWYFYDMFLFVLGPVGWVVDGVTGSWNDFSRLDVDRALRRAGAASGGAQAMHR